VFAWCGRPRVLGRGMSLLQSSPHPTLLRILCLAWDTSRGPRCFPGSRSPSLPLSHLARVPTNPTGPAPLSPTRTLVHQEVSIMGSVRLRTNPRGSFTSLDLHRSRPRVKGTRPQRTITFHRPRSRTRISTTSRIPTPLQARDLPLNQMHHQPCTILKTSTIRPSRTSSRIRRYPRYQVLLPVTPLPSSTLAAINF
jgi:hypothetical protein